MRTSGLGSILVAAVAAGGCFQSTTLIRINGDGSGTIEQTTLVTAAALRQLRQFAAMGAESGKPPDLFSASQARQMAAAIGADASTVSSTRIKTPEGEGSKATFAFADIRRLQFKQGPGSSDDPADSAYAMSTGAPQVRFALTRQADGHALLKIIMPPARMPSRAASTAPAGSGGRPQDHLAPEQLAMVKQMFAGMRIKIAVEPAGELVKTSSPFVDGRRVTLVDVAFDQLLANEAAFTRLQSARTIDDVRAAMTEIPGLKVNLDPEITIEFNPAK